MAKPADTARQPWIPGLLLTAVVLVAGVGALVPFQSQGRGLNEGERAPTTLRAQHDAQFESAVLTETLRAEQARKVGDKYFPPDPALAAQQLEKLRALFAEFRTIRLRTDLTSIAQRLTEAARIEGASAISPASQATLLGVDTLDAAGFRALQDRTEVALEAVLKRPVEPGTVEDRVRDFLQTPAGAELAGGARTDIVSASRELLRAFVVENVKVDQDATRSAQERARASVAAVTVTYSAGQVIATEDKVLSGADIEALLKTGVISEGYDYYGAAGGVLAAAVAALLVAGYLVSARATTRLSFRGAAAVGLAFLCAAAAARFVLPELMPDRDSHYLPFALPFAAVALVAAAAGGSGLGVVSAVCAGWLGAFAGAAGPDLAGSGYIGSLQSFELAAAITAGGIAGAQFVGRAPGRQRLAAGGGVLALAAGAVMAAFWLIAEPRDPDHLAWIALAGAVSGASAAVIAWLFAGLAGASSPASRAALVRLASPAHPLLSRLRSEAPGTYHHSQAVAELAENAAQRIGADALLARVGALYHDIGKLAQPGHFVENFPDPDVSPHGRLSPEESASVIRGHVTDGIRLGRENGLPEAVCNFIPEHHGTRLVSYFYRQAVRSGSTVDTERFRYAGPRPRSRETAVVMLADSCEATVRAHDDRSASNIDRLVDGILAERIAEAQFDDCPITTRELRTVVEAFKETLRVIYHPRVAYPGALPEELAQLGI
jgi:cyclic-di-AMP phosphodiesterase PgpH